jgi:DNA-binding LacI/PurR family transcriptional regulator
MTLGARPPNIRDVARRAGVSATTVSRVLNGTLEPATSTRSSIEAAIRDLGYVPNPHARRLGRGRSDALALLVPDISAPFFARLVASAEAEAGRRGLELELHVTMNRPDRERRYLQAIQRNHVDGVIVATNHPDDGRLAERCRAAAGWCSWTRTCRAPSCPRSWPTTGRPGGWPGVALRRPGTGASCSWAGRPA